MFESLAHEAATRFHLGDNAPRFVRMLVDAIFDSGNGGFGGMRSRFDHAGLGDLFATWIGTSPGDNVLQPDQFSAGFGEAAAHNIATRLGIPVASVNMAGAWLLPKIVGLVTRGGAIPSARPADYDSWFAASAPAAAAASTSTYGTGTAAASASGGGWWKWLLGLIVVAALLFFGLRACKHDAAPGDDAAATADAGATDATSADSAAAPAADVGTTPADGTATDATPPADAAPTDGTAASPDATAGADTTAAEGAATPDAATALGNLKPGGSVDDLLKALNLMIIHFDTGSANISSESLEILGKAAEAIKAMPAGTKIEVGGHTDNTGNATANQTLSQRRADAVVAKLGELGVAAGTLTAKGYGQDQPKADNGTEEGRAQNRRIEFTAGK